MSTATDSSLPVPMSTFVYGFEPGYIEELLSHVLSGRKELSESARSALNSAIDDGVRLDDVRLDGFRDASKVPPHLLTEPLLENLAGGDDRLASVVLRAWMEGRDPLRKIVESHLLKQGVDVEGVNFRKRTFSSLWPRDQWMREVISVTEDHPGLGEDDVGLMVCCVSGMSVGPEEEHLVESDTLSGWLDQLRELPPDAPDWIELGKFVLIAAEIAGQKSVEQAIAQAEAFLKSVASIQEDFGPELRYLELDMGPESLGMDPESRSRELVESPALVAHALDLAEELRGILEKYRAVRPQADSRSEETGRAVERERLEAEALGIAAKWAQLAAPPDDPNPETPPEGPAVLSDGAPAAGEAEADHPAHPGHPEAEPASDGRPAPGAQESGEVLEAERTVPAVQYEVLASELDSVKQDGESVNAENARLADANADLESEKESLQRANDRKQEELSQSRATEEAWRLAYVDAKVADAGSADEAPAEPTSVREAVDLAEQTFPDTLLFALNSKSEEKKSPFQKPDEVFDALAWLATAYHQRRLTPGKSPQFNRSLKESCPNWSYKPKQTDVTKEQFKEWYETTVDGKRYKLDAHLGRGARFDPQHTIRIAFAWDDEGSRVIVGYIGLHQRNRRS